MRRRSSGGTIAVVLIVVVLGAVALWATGPRGDRGAVTGSAPSAVAADAPTGSAGSALALLSTLRVKGPAPLTGYERTEVFGAAWLDEDHSGCDTRDQVLARDLSQVVRRGCDVERGVLADPYTRTVIHFERGERTSAAVQIDHIVPLADAWKTGAQALTQDQRERLANDPIELLAVDGPTNQAKGDGDAATWLPPNHAFRCTYIAHQVAVKAAYRLWVTPAERAAMLAVLRTCPDVTAPRSTLAGG